MAHERQRELKAWESGNKKWDLTEESRKANYDLLKYYGRDQLTFAPETLALRNEFLRYNEAKHAHGYPGTAWLQLAIIYGCGIYTAQEQGILRRGQFFKNFWSHHYFDWILWGRRSFAFGIVGGLVAGTVMFGDMDLSMRRAYSKYQYYFSAKVSDPRANEDMWRVKFNN